MTRFFHALARRLYRYRPILLAISGGSICAFGAIVFVYRAADEAVYALASMTILLWALWLLAITLIFVDPLPAPDPAATFSARLRSRLRQGFGWLVALMLAVLLVIALSMTARTLGLLYSNQG